MPRLNPPKITKEALKAMAESVGLSLSDERLEHLLPQMQAIIHSMAKLDELDLADVPPAFVFSIKQS